MYGLMTVLVASQLFLSGPCPGGRCPNVRRGVTPPAVIVQVDPAPVTVVPDVVPDVAPPTPAPVAPVVSSGPVRVVRVCGPVCNRRGLFPRFRARCRRWSR